jgi:hypothetical protein
MTDQPQHRATPEQISMCVYPGDLATDPRKVAVVINALSDRIEALEAAQQDKLDRLIALDREDPTPDPAMAELRAASDEAQPGGLVERVAARIEYGIDAELDPEGIARAVIREQAAWLETKGRHGCSLCLREESDRG